jgi:uncharacterized protein YbjT (DUF2867 family)
MINKIAVIGATGMLGKPVTRALAQNGFKISALVRDRLKANLPEGVNKIDGDIANVKSLERLLTDQDALYLNLSIKQHEKEKDFHTESEGLKNILAAARTKNLKRIVYLSSMVMRYQGMNGFHWWAFDIKQKAVQMIKDSGIPYTVFYPSNFMDNFHTTYRSGNRILLSGTSSHKMWWVSAEDYARQVVVSLKHLSLKIRTMLCRARNRLRRMKLLKSLFNNTLTQNSPFQRRRLVCSSSWGNSVRRSTMVIISSKR